MEPMIQSLVLSTAVLPPHATTHGFLFYDMDHQFDAIRYSSCTSRTFSLDGQKGALFFEIDLHPSLELTHFVGWIFADRPSSDRIFPPNRPALHS